MHYIGNFNAIRAKFDTTGTLNLYPTTNQIKFGTGINITTINSPPPSGSVTINLPNTNTNLIGHDTTDTLTNKTLTSPIINNPTITGYSVPNSITTASSSNIPNSIVARDSNNAFEARRIYISPLTSNISRPFNQMSILELPNVAYHLIDNSTPSGNPGGIPIVLLGTQLITSANPNITYQSLSTLAVLPPQMITTNGSKALATYSIFTQGLSSFFDVEIRNNLTTIGNAAVNIGADNASNTINIGTNTNTARNVNIGTLLGTGITKVQGSALQLYSAGNMNIADDNTAQTVTLGRSFTVVKNVEIGSYVEGSKTQIAGQLVVNNMSTNLNAYMTVTYPTNPHFANTGTWAATGYADGSLKGMFNSSSSSSDSIIWNVGGGITIQPGTYLLSYFPVSNINHTTSLQSAFSLNGSTTFYTIRDDNIQFPGTNSTFQITTTLILDNAATVRLRFQGFDPSYPLFGLAGSINMTRIY